MIEFEDFAKLEIVVGEVKSVGERGVEIDVGEEVCTTKVDFEVSVGDKIVVGLVGGGVVVFLTDGKNSLMPDQDMEVGSRVS